METNESKKKPGKRRLHKPPGTEQVSLKKWCSSLSLHWEPPPPPSPSRWALTQMPQRWAGLQERTQVTSHRVACAGVQRHHLCLFGRRSGRFPHLATDRTESALLSTTAESLFWFQNTQKWDA